MCFRNNYASVRRWVMHRSVGVLTVVAISALQPAPLWHIEAGG